MALSLLQTGRPACAPRPVPRFRLSRTSTTQLERFVARRGGDVTAASSDGPEGELREKSDSSARLRTCDSWNRFGVGFGTGDRAATWEVGDCCGRMGKG